MNKLNVLDHGFVILRNMAGPTRRPLNEFDASDVDVANSARMSFDNADLERTYEIEMKLNKYLMANKHMTPFEMIEVWFEVKLPIFVARQLVRHRTAGINEVSGRYVQLPAEWYIPALEDVMFASANKKQGGNKIDMGDITQVGKAVAYQRRLEEDCRNSYANYEHSLADGIAMEQARAHLHLNHYTHWLWKQDLRNTLHMLALRDHSHAQGEVQQYARAKIALMEPQIPGLMALFNDLMRF
jgi:thymidylate synthase (FAD)